MGVNTWDLMDKSRYTYNRAEVEARLDAMVKAGWGVGRTWGFSLGEGLSNGPMGKTVADKNKILETGPGARAPDIVASNGYIFAFAGIFRTQVCSSGEADRPHTARMASKR